MKIRIILSLFLLCGFINLKGQSEINNMRRIPGFSNLSFAYENKGKAVLGYSYRISSELAFKTNAKVHLDKPSEVIIKNDTLEVIVNNRYLVDFGLSKKLFQIQDFFFVDGEISIYGSYRKNGFDLEDTKIDYNYLKVDYGLTLGFDGTWYLHRFIALNMTVGLEKTIKDMEFLRSFIRAGLKINLN